MRAIDNILEKTLYYVCAFLMILMTIDIISEVVSRYVMGDPLTWTGELGRYIFVWMSFLGMAAVIPQGSHVALDILVQNLKNVSQKILILIINLLIAFLGVMLTYSGFLLAKLGAMQNSPTLQIPMNYVYIVIPISGILLLYFVLSGTVKMFIKERGVK